jgi:hypothetical protein
MLYLCMLCQSLRSAQYTIWERFISDIADNRSLLSPSYCPERRYCGCYCLTWTTRRSYNFMVASAGKFQYLSTTATIVCNYTYLCWSKINYKTPWNEFFSQLNLGGVECSNTSSKYANSPPVTDMQLLLLAQNAIAFELILWQVFIYLFINQ